MTEIHSIAANHVSISARPWLFLPVELQVRELAGKLLLSLFAVEAGFGVVLGHSLSLSKILPSLSPGIFIDKSVTRQRESVHATLREAGHKVVAWCEEGLVTLDAADYVSRRLSREVLCRLDLFFAWGEHQASLVRAAAPEIGNSLVMSGNPRMDLLRAPFCEVFRPHAERFQKAYGDYLLINTNFGFCNHFQGADAAIKSLQEQKKLASAERVRFFREWMSYKRRLMESMMKMIQKLAEKLPDKALIVRPHPTENQETYRRYFRRFRNVKVTLDGPVQPWIMGAKALIHNGCTTAVEAHLLGKPVYAYQPFVDARFDCDLPNEVSRQISSDDEVIGYLRTPTANRLSASPNRESILSPHLAALDGKFSCERIVEELKLLDVGGYPLALKATAPTKLKDPLLTRFLKRSGIARDVSDYRRHKFAGMSLDNLKAEIKSFQNVTNRFASVQVQAIAPNLFAVVK